MKRLTALMAAVVLSGFGAVASADNFGNDYGAHIEVTPSVSERATQLNASTELGVTPEVTPAQGERAVAQFNEAIDAS